jgi:plasmid replication initiation protein
VDKAAKFGSFQRASHGNVAGMGDLVQLSLFTVSTVDPPWRDNRDAMAYPFLSLQKRRTTPIEFERNGLSIGVHAPAEFGLATIWDWDLIIFAASHLNQAIEDGRKPARRISFVPYDCMKQIRRPIWRRALQEAGRSDSAAAGNDDHHQYPFRGCRR